MREREETERERDKEGSGLGQDLLTPNSVVIMGKSMYLSSRS